MQELLDFLRLKNIETKQVVPIAQSGGDRQYYIITTIDDQQLIGTVSEHLAENEAFFSFTETFSLLNLPVPKILYVHPNQQMYIQSFAGKETLLDVILKDGYTPENFNLYKKVLAQLAKLQILSDSKINYSKCIAAKQFDASAVLFDLHYCRTYFAEAKNITYDQNELTKEFVQISETIQQIPSHYFMYRDCQGRNIMIDAKNNFTFIDYQGGMRGPLQYDVASLLWQAKAQLPDDWREDLLLYYFNSAQLISGNTLEKESFMSNYYLVLLVRLLQVLGAYGRRGLLEGKQHFIESIPGGIANLKSWQAYKDISQDYPHLHQFINQIIQLKS